MKRTLLATVSVLSLWASSAWAVCPGTTLTFKDAGNAVQTLCFGGAAGAFIPQYQILDSGGTNALSVSAAGAAKVDGSAVTQPVSGTVTANIGTSGSLALDASVTGLEVGQGSTTSGQKGILHLGAVTTAAPSYTTAQSSPLSLNLSGGLRVDGSGVTQPVSGTFFQATQPVSGTVTANAGTNLNTSALALDTSVNGVLAAQGSTTSGEKGPLVQGAVTTAAPSYTTAQTSPLSLTTAGNLRVDGSTVTQPVSGTVSVNALPTGANVIGKVGIDQTTPGTTNAVQPIPGTAGGWTPILEAALSTTVQTVKASAGKLGSYYCYNPNASVAYIQIFDTSGTVTLGTTVPLWSIGIPATAAANLGLGMGMNFANAIKVAATTTAKGSVAPGTAIDCNFGFN